LRLALPARLRALPSKVLGRPGLLQTRQLPNLGGIHGSFAGQLAQTIDAIRDGRMCREEGPPAAELLEWIDDVEVLRRAVCRME